MAEYTYEQAVEGVSVNGYNLSCDKELRPRPPRGRQMIRRLLRLVGIRVVDVQLAHVTLPSPVAKSVTVLTVSGVPRDVHDRRTWLVIV